MNDVDHCADDCSQTTIGGLSGCHPDYVMVLVAANNGVSRMTREHLGVALALQLPLLVVVTKIDICPPNVRHELQCNALIRSSIMAKKPLMSDSETHTFDIVPSSEITARR